MEPAFQPWQSGSSAHNPTIPLCSFRFYPTWQLRGPPLNKVPEWRLVELLQGALCLTLGPLPSGPFRGWERRRVVLDVDLGTSATANKPEPAIMPF